MKRFKLRYAVLCAVLAGTIVLGALAFFRMSAPAPSGAGASAGSLTAAPEARTTALVYGDSISQGDSAAFSRQDLGNRAWPKYLSQNGVYFVGGYAQGGLTAGMLIDRDLCQEGTRASVVVAAFGTNSLLLGESFETNLKNLERLKAECGGTVPPSAFLVTAVGPMDRLPPARISDWNTRLAAAAAERGWAYVDPFQGLRTSENTWPAGLSIDGLHPAEAAAEIYAANIAPNIIAAGR